MQERDVLVPFPGGGTGPLSSDGYDVDRMHALTRRTALCRQRDCMRRVLLFGMAPCSRSADSFDRIGPAAPLHWRIRLTARRGHRNLIGVVAIPMR